MAAARDVRLARPTQPETPRLARILSMTGLQFVKAMRAGEVPPPPLADVMNCRLHEVEEGRVTFRGAPEDRHANPFGTTHGGWYGAILDSAMTCAVMTALPRGETCTTLDYRVTVIRPVPPAFEVEATGVVDRSGRSTAVASGEIRGLRDRTLYATGTTTCLVVRVVRPDIEPAPI